MSLSLLDLDHLYTNQGTLFSRTRAACGQLARQWYLNSSVTLPQQEWAAAFTANPTATAVLVYNGVITDSSILVLDMESINVGTLPIDSDLLTLVGSILTQYVGT